MCAVASIIRVFRACPVPDNRLLGGLPMDKFPDLPPCRILWWQGKKQGISRIQPLFAKISLENICNSRYLREIIPYEIEQGINSRKQGINSAFWTGAGNLARNRSARPDAYQAIRLPLYRDVSSSRTRGSRFHDLVWLAVSAPLSGSRRRLIVAPQLDTRFRGYDTCCLGRPWG